VKAVEEIATGLAYNLSQGVDDCALREWYLDYDNHCGALDGIHVEIIRQVNPADVVGY
jgi:hypothetical protein